METFATRGYNNASLAEVAARVGLTQAGVLHHFPSKAGLLTGVLDLRDATEIGELGDERPRGMAFLRHLVDTAKHNAAREGIVRLYAVLSAESVTDGHPAQNYFRTRYQGLRTMVVDALHEAVEHGEVPTGLDHETVATAIIATMDGLQVQWLLAPDSIDMAAATETTIRALTHADLPPSPEPFQAGRAG
ncbi:helix-turn-helix transcriptional regulator [Kribbella qitaiheensis]|uniref:Helix-turn-helix transcriptional regulator n=2 Tax=Kribbella qitaiheensis TaxID=1544730 RepID=A0A7G6X953_9ACTN|nr:helix-turn-helix transcriptional regulator [Kribbella qitaiheensis]